jgi:hypothetical protein
MDFHVGNDDLTADKDYKHVFKRFRNLLLRQRGVTIMGFQITPAIIRSHLQSAGASSEHLHALFKPRDSQDVKLAFDLLKDIWSLPSLSSSTHARPGFVAAREALRTLGKLFYHVVFPYLCTDLSLSEQLEHLSAAAHLALVLYTQARKDFLPTLLYVDTMIMIKNAFFCVAKAKVDDPHGRFWLSLLGTDRLEELFGILRTMVGNDANLDILQLTCRLTGTTEVANILAKYPHWDRGPRRLKLPAITRDSTELPDEADHIKPASWRGEVDVKHATLLTCWKRGRRLVEADCPFVVNLLASWDSKPEVDILSPFGTLLLDVPLDDDDNEDNEDETQNDSSLALQSTHRPQISISTELEDAIAEEQPESNKPSSFDRSAMFQGKRLPKARILALRSKYKDSPSSTDRLKRVAEVERYAATSGEATRGNIIEYDSAFGGPCLLISEPIATLVRCEKKVFLGIGEVNDIKIDSQSVEQLGLDVLAENTVVISYQVLSLVPATVEDDAEMTNDWRSCSMLPPTTLSVPGRLIQVINPTVSTGNSLRKPCYLFESSVLRAFGAALFDRLTVKDFKSLPKLTPTKDFPYREGSGTCHWHVCILINVHGTFDHHRTSLLRL